MKCRWLGLAFVLAMGCGGEARDGSAKFKSPTEERAYLESLSNPTVEQFRRREELRETAKKAEDHAEREKAMDWAKNEIRVAGLAEKKGKLKDALGMLEEAIYWAKPYPESDTYQSAVRARDRMKRLVEAADKEAERKDIEDATREFKRSQEADKEKPK